jgi:hypothetical protein
VLDGYPGLACACAEHAVGIGGEGESGRGHDAVGDLRDREPIVPDVLGEVVVTNRVETVVEIRLREAMSLVQAVLAGLGDLYGTPRAGACRPANRQ